MTDAPAAGSRLGYLGPAGTFTEQALRVLHPDAVDPWPAPTVAAAADAVRAGELEAVVVPFENSVEGAVPATLDELVRGEPLMITAEAHVRVQFALLARQEMPLDRVQRLASHPHALAQVRRWVARHLPEVEVVPESSTAQAAARVAEGAYDVAVAAPTAAGTHGLVVLADRIGDAEAAVTRFVRLARPGPPPPPTGADTTTLVAFIRQNRPGALLEILEQFAVRGVDLTRLESRPTGQGLGQYCFTIDAVGHVAEPRVAEALSGLHRTCRQVRFLGSYPRADGVIQPVAPEAGEQAWGEARDWVRRLVTGG